MSANPNTPVTKADLEAFEQRIMQQFDRMSRLMRLEQVRQAFRLADRINAVTPTQYTENDIEHIIDEVRTELQAERESLQDQS
jgi:hypothetical protein